MTVKDMMERLQLLTDEGYEDCGVFFYTDIMENMKPLAVNHINNESHVTGLLKFIDPEYKDMIVITT